MAEDFPEDVQVAEDSEAVQVEEDLVEEEATAADQVGLITDHHINTTQFIITTDHHIITTTHIIQEQDIMVEEEAQEAVVQQHLLY